MINYSVINKNYPNIFKVFTQDWFDKEITKNKNEMHLLAKKFTFMGQDGSSLDSDSLQCIDYLEKILKDMKDEINSKRKHFKNLTDKNHFLSTVAEIEIGFFLKNIGFEIEFEPSISGGKSDIKIVSDGLEVFIEVSTRRGHEYLNLEETGEIEKIDGKRKNFIRIRTFKFQQPDIYRNKLSNESNQLSKSNPGIIALYLDPSSISERMNIIRGFGFDRVWGTNENIVHIEKGEIINNSMISAVLLYISYFGDKPNFKELYLNPKADNQLPDSLITKFRDFGTKIINPVPY